MTVQASGDRRCGPVVLAQPRPNEAEIRRHYLAGVPIPLICEESGMTRDELAQIFGAELRCRQIRKLVVALAKAKRI